MFFQRRAARCCLAAVGLLALLLSLGSVPSGVRAQDWDTPVPSGPNSPAVASLFAAMPTCMQPDPAINECYVNWQAIFAEASAGESMTSMVLRIDGQVRAVYQGFFETYLYVDDPYHDLGFQVPCGPYGASGDPSMGLVHTFTIQAEDTGGFGSFVSGSVACPGVRLLFLPLVIRASP